MSLFIVAAQLEFNRVVFIYSSVLLGRHRQCRTDTDMTTLAGSVALAMFFNCLASFQNSKHC
jgi:hypothetical protein